MKKLLELFKREKKAKKGLMAIEWVVMGYLAITTLLMLFTYTKVHNPGEMLWGRVQIVIMTLALWRCIACCHVVSLACVAYWRRWHCCRGGIPTHTSLIVCFLISTISLRYGNKVCSDVNRHCCFRSGAHGRCSAS